MKQRKQQVKSYRLKDLFTDTGIIFSNTLVRVLVAKNMDSQQAHKEWNRLLTINAIAKSSMIGGYGEKTVQGYKVLNFDAEVFWS